MLKLVGAVLVIGAAGASGMMVAQGYARRFDELRALHAALALLSTEISFGLTPLPDALEQVGRRAGRRVGELFSDAAALLRCGDGRTAEEAWAQALGRFAAGSALRPEDLAALAGLGATLGASDREDQVCHPALAMERLKSQGMRAEEEARNNVRLWRYLGFLGGVAVVLMLS